MKPLHGIKIWTNNEMTWRIIKMREVVCVTKQRNEQVGWNYLIGCGKNKKFFGKIQKWKYKGKKKKKKNSLVCIHSNSDPFRFVFAIKKKNDKKKRKKKNLGNIFFL